jgi:hypothetical protein
MPPYEAIMSRSSSPMSFRSQRSFSRIRSALPAVYRNGNSTLSGQAEAVSDVVPIQPDAVVNLRLGDTRDAHLALHTTCIGVPWPGLL